MNRLPQLLLMLITAIAPLTWAYDAYCICQVSQNHIVVEHQDCCPVTCPTKAESEDSSCKCDDGCDHELAQEPYPATVVNIDNNVIKNIPQEQFLFLEQFDFVSVSKISPHLLAKPPSHSNQIDCLKTVFLLI